MNKPTVSIIIPAHNAESTLSETVQSALEQTYQDFEIIIVNDCSTDGTKDVAERLRVMDSRIKVIHSEQNVRVARARNMGISASSGDLVAPLDSDDIWHPKKLERQIKKLGSNGFVYCPNRRINESNIIIDSSPYFEINENAFDLACLFNFVGNGSAPLFNREAIEDIGGYCEDLNVDGVEDAFLQVRVAEKWPVASVPAFLVGYRLSANSISSSHFRMYTHRVNMLDKIASHCPRANLQLLRFAQAWSLGQRAMRELGTGRAGPALVSIRRFMALDGAAGFESMWAYSRRKSREVTRRSFGRDGWIGRKFLDVDPEAGIAKALNAPPDPRVRRLERRNVLISSPKKQVGL